MSENQKSEIRDKKPIKDLINDLIHRTGAEFRNKKELDRYWLRLEDLQDAIFYLKEFMGAKDIDVPGKIAADKNDGDKTGDLISRKAALDALNECFKDHFISDFDAIASILDLPAAEPERTAMVKKPKKGCSVISRGRCGCCGFGFTAWCTDFIYCPQCGAKLDWSEDE